MNYESIADNLSTQLSELESLQSMFYNPGEIRVESPEILSDFRDFIAKKSQILPQNLDLTISLTIDNSKFELCVSLSHEYPTKTTPEIFVRNPYLNRTQHKDLNRDLNAFVDSQEKGEPCIFSAISWLTDNAQNYGGKLSPEVEQAGDLKKSAHLVRYWIYSHHIYSKTKRKAIIELAGNLNLTGFSMPGKPGIVCVEGDVSDCDEWLHLIKCMNWKKIYCKASEENKEDCSDFRKFSDFKEVVFPNSGVKCTHMDMGELFKYLEDRRLGYIFKELFGVVNNKA